MTYNKEIGARIREARKKRGCTQESIARHFDVDKSTISKYESGINTPDIEFLQSFARHFKINGDWLLFGEPPMFKAGQLNRDLVGMLLELLASLREAESVERSRDQVPGLIRHSLENLTEDTPDNFLVLMNYMANDHVARREIFK
ncbi:MAG: helix-turn-helix transcriptional regulator, partial [bacterium]|nr:helix-turn-helix transcriptional regulator [bacterium]